MNVQGLTKNISEIKQLLLEENPLIVCMSETHVTEDIENDEINIPGYKNYICHSHSRHTGGAIIYIKNYVNATVINTEFSLPDFWSVAVKATIGNIETIIGSIYRSPNGSCETFFNFFENILNDDMISRYKTIIAGDFNIRMETENAYSKKLNNIANDAGFKQIVTEYTRITQNTNSLIDLIFTNDYNLQEIPRNYPHITDHIIIGCYMEGENNKETDQFKYFRNLGKDNVEKIILDLYEKSWEYTSTNVTHIYQVFVNNIMESINKVAPQEKIKSNNKPWINTNVKNAQKERDIAYKKFKVTKRETDWSEYKRKRNRVVTITRAEQSHYYENHIDKCKGDSTKMWKTLKGLVGKKKGSNVEKIEFETDLGSQEDNFNSFYINSITAIADSIPTVDESFQNVIEPVKEHLVNFNHVTFSQLHKIVKNLKNKATYDEGLSIKLLKDIFVVVGYPLLYFINMSLSTGRIPSALKTSIVVPIPKVLSPTQPADYRPINLLPVIDKILEIVVCEQLRRHFENNNIIYEGQSGFREKHSCEAALQFVCAKWREAINDGQVVLSVFIDLQRAFETIDRSRLLAKLEKYGVKDGAWQWLNNYLDDRYQRTKISGQISNTKENLIGVPQGSVLGPLLFVIYINDLHNVLSESFVSLFADDTLISISGRDYDDITSRLNTQLEVLYNWLCANKLKLNPNKSKCMVLGKKQNCRAYRERNLNICINNIELEKVTQFKYLGFILDTQLTFSTHVDYMCRKVGKKIGFFYRVSNNLSLWSKRLIYNTIIYPHFNYCISLLFSCTKTDVDRLQVLQNKAMRIVLSCSRCTSVDIMLRALHWISVGQLIEKANLMIIYKIKNNLMPNYLQTRLVTRSELHSYNVRSKYDYNIEFVRSAYMQKCLFGDGLRLFNALPETVKQSNNIHVFSKRLTNLYFV